jgi:YihY family inner membrane protein
VKWIDRADRYQRAHGWAGLPVAVVRKFVDDEAGYLAALLTYYGFLSVFPLLLIFTTLLGFLLGGDPGLRQRLLHTALNELPVAGGQIASNIHTLHGSVPALVAGVLITGYGALRAARAAQNALNRVWAIPRRDWPSPVHAYLRAAALVAGLGVALLAATALSALTTTGPDVHGGLGVAAGAAIRAAASVAATAINTGVFVLAFRVLTARQIPLRDLRGGAIAAGVAWQLLQEISTFFASRGLHGSSATYGWFSIVLGLMAWIYLGALITVVAAEVNAVRAKQLWPRALRGLFTEHTDLTPADRLAYAEYAEAQRHTASEKIEVTFDQLSAAEAGREPAS